MGWLALYSAEAEKTDTFKGHKDHASLLAAGLLGEVGSIVAEIKKMNREAEAYPGYRRRISEELGDFLWYFVRLANLLDAPILNDLPATQSSAVTRSVDITRSLELASTAGQVLQGLQAGNFPDHSLAFKRVWAALSAVAAEAGVNLQDAATANLAKIRSRWPSERIFHPLFDENFPVEEQIPRSLTIDFLERRRGNRTEVLLRCNALGLGDRVTDNIQDADDYRYHDIFHIAYAVFLGWSPMVRGLLRCKRKSDSAVDENQDGARAGILEEAVSAVVFGRAKQMRFFEAATQLDYDLLKTVQEFVKGYEVEQIPLWQWEKAILEGYRIFRQLRSARGGRVNWNLRDHALNWAPLNEPVSTVGRPD